MISRRSFLKVSGLAAVALSTGYGAGKLTNNSNTNFFAVNGFIPADEKILRELIFSFTEAVKPSGNAVVFADSRHTSIIRDIYNQRSTRSENGNVHIRLTKINAPVQADIMISNSSIAVLNPEYFNPSFSGIREKVQNRKAEYFVSAEFREENIFGSLFSSNNKIAVIENEKGIVDKISLKDSFKNLVVKGPNGNTGIAMREGLVEIHSAACKNQICKHSGKISETGQIIACAPNKVLIRIETV